MSIIKNQRSNRSDNTNHNSGILQKNDFDLRREFYQRELEKHGNANFDSPISLRIQYACMLTHQLKESNKDTELSNAIIHSIHNSGRTFVSQDDGTRFYYINQCLWISIIQYLKLVENIDISICDIRKIASDNGNHIINDEKSMFDMSHINCLHRVLNNFKLKLRLFIHNSHKDLNSLDSYDERLVDISYHHTINSDKSIFIKYSGEHFELIYKINDELVYTDVGIYKIQNYLLECTEQISINPDETNIDWIHTNNDISTNLSLFLQNNSNSTNLSNDQTVLNDADSLTRIDVLFHEIELLRIENENYDCILQLDDIGQIESNKISELIKQNKILQNNKEKLINDITVKMYT